MHDQKIVLIPKTYVLATQQGGAEIGEDMCPTITAAAGMSGNNQPVVFAIDRAAFNQGKNAQYEPQIDEGGVAHTVVARGPGAVCHKGEQMSEYIVRRLTPTECCRLQGFPDGWGEIDHKDDFTDEEYQFWLDVRKTHAGIMGKQVKDYTKEQMLTWYNKLHTDSAEYKMWGNGISLPTAMYVLEGIAIELDKEENNDD